ncbi:hypothetical protein ACFU44_32465 [Nocardia rhizosphaerihabitans]|uniref:hypothetical protein n=1 Tax=Nocardia rhizosphaerihabitans TaxID=1691570 RepID=UPI00366A87F5
MIPRTVVGVIIAAGVLGAALSAPAKAIEGNSAVVEQEAKPQLLPLANPPEKPKKPPRKPKSTPTNTVPCTCTSRPTPTVTLPGTVVTIPSTVAAPPWPPTESQAQEGPSGSPR